MSRKDASNAGRGLLHAIEAQAARLPVEVVVHADPALRETRFPSPLETAAWYLLSESLTNAVKHSGADRVSVTLRRPGRCLLIEVADDGNGFDPAAGRGLGPSAMADRVSIMDGTLDVFSAPGQAPASGPSSRSDPRRSNMRIIVADDNYLVREGTRRLLEESGEVDVLAAVGSAPELLDAVSRLHPDAVLTDIRMPVAGSAAHSGDAPAMEGITAAHRIKATSPDIGVVILSQYADEAYAFELFRNGTAGLAYLLKDRVGDLGQLMSALREVGAGGSVIDPLVVEALITRRARLRESPLTGLTPREIAVLREMAQGRGNTAIGRSLSLSESSVEKYVNGIFTKLGLSNEHHRHRRVAAVLTFLRDSSLYT